MSGMLEVTENSSNNIQKFIDALEDKGVAQLLKQELGHILAVGRLDTSNASYEEHREAFFGAVEQLICDRMRNYED